MGLTEQVARSVGLSTLSRNGMELVAAEETSRFLDGCQKSGVRILGVEGFQVEARSITPDMNAIADFSVAKEPYTVSDSVRDARQFLQATARTGMWFEFELRQEVTRA